MKCIEFAFLKDVEIGRCDLMYRTVLSERDVQYAKRDLEIPTVPKSRE